ncbi:transcriptional regulator [Paenibacillus sp. GCM10012306]|uniref:helix-turn-helix domain-containing protein n=1 Tax=Paenibacillus sp. GCM10012306 TaxID=3317342 RepID=UPI00360DCF92
MKAASTILTELDYYLKSEALTLAQFAERSGLHSGTLSNIIHGRRPIAMQQLDRITSAIGRTEGFFYDLYIQEYVIEGAADWRRIGPLLQRCAELDKLDEIKRVVQHVMDNLMYSPLLFESAESLFTQGYRDAAGILYDSVAEGEKLQHSERLALCQYRLFAIRLGEDQDENLRAANQFEPFVERLDEADQLDALKHLADIYGSLDRLDKVEQLAELLENKAKIQFKYWRRDQAKKKSTRPYVFYILYAYLSRSAVADERGEYEKALYYTSLYSNLDWIKPPLSEEEKLVLDQFKEWATANTYVYRLMSGQVEILDEYVSYISTRDEEIFTALYKITQAANHFNLNIDGILEQFKSHLVYNIPQSQLGKFNHQLTDDRYTRFLIELATYYLGKKETEVGFNHLINGLEFSVRNRSSVNIVRCVGLFEKYRKSAPIYQLETYSSLISQIHETEEKVLSLL